MVEVDVWVRGTLNAKTHRLELLPTRPDGWTDEHVRALIMGMLRALERQSNPSGEPADIFLRGFSWIVNPYEPGSVLVHVEMPLGTASAGPIAIDEPTLTAAIRRVVSQPTSSELVH